ncbi:hypothetical protein AM593_10393, partial [Mytilus galloprovincialis]
MTYESLQIGTRRGEDLKLQDVVVRETLDLINKAVVFTCPTKNKLDEKHINEESQDEKQWPSTRKTDDGNYTSPTLKTIEESGKQNQDKHHSPSTRKQKGINDQRKKTTESNNPFRGNRDQNIGRHSDKSHDVRCTSSTVITIEEKVVYDKQQESNKSTGKKE